MEYSKSSSVESCYEPVKLPHGANNIGEISPSGEDVRDVMMGPTAGMDSGTALTPMKAGIGEIPVDGKSSSVPGAKIDGIHNVGSIDGKGGLGMPGSGGSMESHKGRAGGMTYDYPGL